MAIAKRRIVQALTKQELLAIADTYGLEVEDRRVRDQLIEAAAASREVELGAVLRDMSRDRLKELCREVGLDDSGKEKAPIIERLIGSRAGITPSSQPNGAQANGAKANGGRTNAAKVNGGSSEQLEISLGDKLSVDQLERHLWSAADILRGSIDSSDYTSFIFGLMFLKRLSDR